MNKKQATSSQIKEIMGYYNFERALKHRNEYLREEDMETVSIGEYVQDAVELMEELNSHSMIGSGFWTAMLDEGEENGQKWLKVSLFHGESTIQDGVDYE